MYWMKRSHCSVVPLGDKSTQTLSEGDLMKEFSRSSSSGVISPAANRRISSARCRSSMRRMSIGSLMRCNLLPLAFCAKLLRLRFAGKLLGLLLHFLNLLFLPATCKKDQAAFVVSLGTHFCRVSVLNDECETTGIDDTIAGSADDLHRYAGDGEFAKS